MPAGTSRTAICIASPNPQYSVYWTFTTVSPSLWSVFHPAEVASGEVWYESVRELEVVDEDVGIIGWIYADLFARRGKASGAAHYTVRCSRRTDDDDEPGDAVAGDAEETIAEHLAFGSVKRYRIRGEDGVYQLPPVVLLREFAIPTINNGPTFLEWRVVQTLFHEMGHAMHCKPLRIPPKC